MDEMKNGRITIEDLPQAEQHLTTEEAKEVKGGILIGMLLPAVKNATAAAETPQLIRNNVVQGNKIGTD